MITKSYPFHFLGGPDSPFFLSIILSNLWPRCRSTYNPGSINFHLSAFTFGLKIGGQGQLSWRHKSLWPSTSIWIRGPLLPFSVHRSYMCSGKFTFYNFWGHKHLGDSVSGTQKGIYMALSHLTLTRSHQGGTTPILQMKSQRVRLTCPKSIASKWLKSDSHMPCGVSHVTPTLSHLEFDTRIIESLFWYLTFAEHFEFPMWLNLCCFNPHRKVMRGVLLCYPQKD